MEKQIKKFLYNQFLDKKKIIFIANLKYNYN